MKISDKRDKIIQSALDLIAERGFHGAPMAEIAEVAGVGAGTIYRYFASKDILIEGLFENLKEKINAYLMEGYQESKPIRERLIHLCTRLVDFFTAHPLYFSFVEQYFHSPFGVSLRRDKLVSGDHDLFIEIFYQGIAQKVLKDLPLFILAALTFSPLLSLVRDRNLGLITADEELILKCIEASWDGIKK